jgi:hypothetical protein
MCPIDDGVVLARQREVRWSRGTWWTRESLVLMVELRILIESLRELVVVLEGLVYLLCRVKGKKSALASYSSYDGTEQGRERPERGRQRTCGDWL